MEQVRCPICNAAMPGNRKDYPDYPFCSRRCRMVDLGRWLGEDYRVGGGNPDDRSTPADADDSR
ncbi:DNA gyrase inhibitor YacG [bacterium]|nr:DNA gyrase inhibitor YacG [bacterium]